MSNKVSDIAKELDKKPSVILSKLKELGIDAPNMNTVLSQGDTDKLYMKMGYRIKKPAPVEQKIEPVVEEEQQVEQSVVVKKRVTVVSKKQYEEHQKNKNAAPSKKSSTVKDSKKTTVKKDDVKKVEPKKAEIEKAEVKIAEVKKVEVKKAEVKKSEPKKVTDKKVETTVKTAKEKDTKVVKDQVVDKEVKKVAITKEPKAVIASKEVIKTKTVEKNPNIREKIVEKEVIRYVKIDKDEINKNRKDFNRKPNDRNNNFNRSGTSTFNRPQGSNNNYRPQGSNNNFRPQTGNSNFRPQTGNSNFRPQTGNSNFRPQTGNSNFRPQTGNSNFRPQTGNSNFRPQTGNSNFRPQTGNSNFGRKPKTDEDKPKIKVTKPKKGDHKKDFDKSFNKAGVKKPVKSTNKSGKYKSQSFVPSGKRGVNEILSEEYIFNEYYSNDNIRKRRKKNKIAIPRREVLRSVKLPESMTVKFLAETIKKQVTDVIKNLMILGEMATINDVIDFDTAALVANEYKIDAVLDAIETEEDILFDDSEEEEDENLESRPPVVVVMGHVDHGKTSLLDAIKKTNIADNEAGNITQHIGAYMVDVNDRKITFLDTPGHEAFTSMRKRGAQVTDIAIIVIAADDGIMPQTIEAISHAKAAGVAIIIAINKIDVRGANLDKVKQGLTEHGLMPEEWGGEVVCVPVSAKTGENIDGLLEMVNLTADMLELKVDPNRQAKGTVIESRVEKSGVIATMLVQRGTLKVGDIVISGYSTGRIKAMKDDKYNIITEAGPSIPVEVLGFDEAPNAGEEFYAVTDMKTAKSLAERRKFEILQNKNKRKSTSVDDLFAQIQEGQIKDLNIIVKGDVRGSVEAVTESLEKIANDEVQVKVIHGAVGTVTESDISLAEVSNAIIIGFNVKPSVVIAELAKDAKVDIRLYNVIYNAIEEIQAEIKGMRAPKFEEVVGGHAEIRLIYKVSGIGTVAGCMVLDGKIERNSDIRVVRDGVVIHEGKLSSLKRFKDDAKEVASGYECGMSVVKFNDIKEGDVFETFKMVQIID